MTPRVLALAGFIGTSAVAAGAWGAGAHPASGRWLGLSTGDSDAATVVVVTGVVLLVAAWWRFWPLLDDVAARTLLATTALWSAPLLLAPPLFSRDVYAYAGQALVVLDGLDPYERGPAAVGGEIPANIDPVWAVVPSPYGPVFLGLAAALLRLADGVTAAVLLLRLLAVLGLVLTAVALPRLARACGQPVPRALWLGVANPLGLLHFVAGAHNDALMLGLLLCGIAVAVSVTPVRAFVAGALIAAGGLVKAPALAGLAFLAAAQPTRRQRLNVALLAGLGAMVLAVAASLLTGLGAGWVGTADSGRKLLSLFSLTTGLGTALGHVLPGYVDDVREPVLTAGIVVALLVSAVLLLRAPALGAVRALGAALLVVVLLSPTVLPWYVLWGAVPLAAATRRPEARALAAMSAVLCFTVWPSGRVLIRPPWYGVALLLALAAALVVYLRERRPG